MGKERKKKKKKLTKSAKDPQNNLQLNEKEDKALFSEAQDAVVGDSNGHNELPCDIASDDKGRKYSVKDFLQKIEEYMDTFNYDLAQKFCEKALEVDADHLELLETAGAVFVETGEVEKAVHCFRHAIELCPEEGHTKYMYLGQSLQGQEAVQAFTKGIEIMTKAVNANTKGAASGDVVTATDISTAYCSLAEIYLTDECFDTEADSKCYQYCEKAVESDPSNPDAYQAMANCLVSQDKIQEAQTALKKGLNLWLGNDEDAQLVPMPSYESRITSSKLLLELADLEVAGSVLQTLLEENDEDPQVWYLLGWMYHLSGQDSTSKKVCLEKAQKLINQSETKDEDILKHIEELLSTATCNMDDDTMENDDDNDCDDNDVAMET